MIQLENIGISFGGETLFKDIRWRVGDLDRVGLVGPNGVGKTTLLRMIKGDLSPECGSVVSSKGTTFGYLPQEEPVLSGRTLSDEVMTVFEPLRRTEARLRKLEHLMGEVPRDDPKHERVMSEYARLQHEFEAHDGFTIETRASEVLAGLGFAERDRDRMTDEFSGGWQMRIALAKLLLAVPSVLLLDEPTNHLDLESMIWLESYLAEYPGAIIMVSHDRSFLDRVVSRITELDAEGLVDYHGTYSTYLKERERRRRALIARRRQQERRIAQIQRFIDKNRYSESKAPLVQSRIKMLQKIELVKIPGRRKGMRFQFPQPLRGGAVAISLKGVRHAYGDNVVLSGVDLDICRGDRIAVVGVNGAGKSTLLRIMAGLVEHKGGERKLGHNVSIMYFGQEPWRTLTQSNTVLEELESVSPDEMRPRLRSLLGSMLFSGREVDKKVQVLSGGEKCRLAIAKMLVQPANFLLLDEPTNHLDVTSREVLEDSLSQYTGTLCFVSHDRYFMDRLSNKVLEVAGGSLKTYIGTYSDYLRANKRETDEACSDAACLAGGVRGRSGPSTRPILPGASGQTRGGDPRGDEDRRTGARTAQAGSGERRASGVGGGRKSREQRRREAEARQRASAGKRARREDRKRILAEIAEGERRLEEIEIVLADPSTYREGEKAKQVVLKQRALRSRVDELCEQWEKLED